MPKKLARLFIASFFAAGLFFPLSAMARGAEIFAKANVSNSYLSRDGESKELAVAGTMGLAFAIINQIRIEGRFMLRYSETNKMDAAGAPYLKDIKTQTNIYSLGLDIDLVGDKYPVQPYIYLGGGYVETMSIFTDANSGAKHSQKAYGPSVNGGIGFRVKLGKSVGFEVEGFAYARNIDKSKPLLDWTGSAGFRIYL